MWLGLCLACPPNAQLHRSIAIARSFHSVPGPSRGRQGPLCLYAPIVAATKHERRDVRASFSLTVNGSRLHDVFCRQCYLCVLSAKLRVARLFLAFLACFTERYQSEHVSNIPFQIETQPRGLPRDQYWFLQYRQRLKIGDPGKWWGRSGIEWETGGDAKRCGNSGGDWK